MNCYKEKTFHLIHNLFIYKNIAVLNLLALNKNLIHKRKFKVFLFLRCKDKNIFLQSHNNI